MPIPALIPAIVSALAWIGIDLGISMAMSDTSEVSYVTGLDFSSFIEAYWLSVILYLLMVAAAIILAVPKHSNNGADFRY